jgi:hypothetical protein
VNLRPAIFEEMGPQFAETFGNCDAVFTIAGAIMPAVSGILRRWRDLDEAEEGGQSVEGTTHLLSVAAASVPGLASQRDSVTVHELDALGSRTGVSASYQIKNHSDDARAMLRIYLSGDI